MKTSAYRIDNAFAACVFAACSDALSDKQGGYLPAGEKAYLSLSVTGAARFIAPAAGVPQDALDMGKAGSANAVSNGTVLIINTAVPVTITNLTLTDGNAVLNAGSQNCTIGTNTNVDIVNSDIIDAVIEQS